MTAVEEFGAMVDNFEKTLKAGVSELKEVMVRASPERKGLLKGGFLEPKKMSFGYRITNTEDHAEIINGGRVEATGGMKARGSKRLPNGYKPIINQWAKTLQRQLDKIK